MGLVNHFVEHDFAELQKLVVEIRKLKACHKVPLKQRPGIALYCPDGIPNFSEEYFELIDHMARCWTIGAMPADPPEKPSATIMIYLVGCSNVVCCDNPLLSHPGLQPLIEASAASMSSKVVAVLLDKVSGGQDKKARAQKIKKLNSRITKLRARLANPNYEKKAPSEVVQQTKNDLLAAERELAELT